MAHGRKYQAARAAIDPDRVYTPLEAVRLLKALETAKFDETVEVHFRLGVNVRHADQIVRGTHHPAARHRPLHARRRVRRGREGPGGERGRRRHRRHRRSRQADPGRPFDFDVAIATPDMMGTVGKLGRILGPRGLMPNPKSGTVTFDVAKAVSDAKAGKVEYRTDRSGIIHLRIGKKSFDETQLVENYGAVLDEILRAKPAAAKGRYLRSVTLTSTMGPSIELDSTKTRDLLEA